MSNILRNLDKTLVIGAILLSVSATVNSADFAPRHQVKEGLAIYLGLLPAEMLEGHTAKSMHGGPPTGLHRYHIAVALFDDKSGARIENAKVHVRINNRIGVGPDSFKELEGMTMNGKLMYGNYYSLQTAGPYRIDVRIYPEGSVKPVEVSFDYDFAHT